LLFGGVGPEEESYILTRLGGITVQEEVSEQSLQALRIESSYRLAAGNYPEFAE
jgi:hypothetical protein